ncbi:hypothetical protein [Rhodospirillaceae bacterium SYSU D60014]|uniref:hypothetical protein n=1 Tax=Virgifigura deserti TaxID=2268457 RepID=UPI000E66F2E1
MTSSTAGDEAVFAEYAKRFVFSAWHVSRAMNTADAANFRTHQQQLFSLLTAMVQARTRCTESFPAIDRSLRRLVTQAMRFVMCSHDNPRTARSFAQGLGERALPLVHYFNDNPNWPVPALPPSGQPANEPANENVIRIDFRARQQH